jgi:hypothetical protein
VKLRHIPRILILTTILVASARAQTPFGVPTGQPPPSRFEGGFSFDSPFQTDPDPELQRTDFLAAGLHTCPRDETGERFAQDRILSAFDGYQEPTATRAPRFPSEVQLAAGTRRLVDAFQRARGEYLPWLERMGATPQDPVVCQRVLLEGMLMALAEDPVPGVSPEVIEGHASILRAALDATVLVDLEKPGEYWWRRRESGPSD